jgi:hypothetical protein
MAVGREHEDGDTCHPLDQHREPFFGGGVDPVQILDLENEQALLTAIDAQLHQSFNGAGPERLWAQHGELIRRCPYPQRLEEVRCPLV